MTLRGRRKITTEYTSKELQSDVINVFNMINATKTQHLRNKTEIDYLIKYSKGQQEILNKEKDIRSEINNKLVINHAQMITRNIIGYFLGTPIQYIQSGDTLKKDELDELNRYVQYEDKSSVDREIGEYQSICGVGYRIIFSDGEFSDLVPFEDKALNPSNTFVIYENTIAEKSIAGVTYIDILDSYGEVVGKKYFVYTDFGLFVIKADNQDGFIDFENNVIDYTFTPYRVGGVPIIEYPNNMWRIGDWEMCIDLMEAISSIHSGRLDDIDQIVQSLIAFINADIDEQTYDEMRAKGVITLTNKTNNKSSIEVISNNLDQTGMNMFAEELERMLYALIGIPDRNNRSGGGGDTGQAVELRDGWADLEIIARNKELVFKKSEKQTLKIILHMISNVKDFKLTPMEVDIKFSRNKNNNLLVKTQSYSVLLSTKTLSPEDCLTIVDLVSDVNEYISRGKSFWGNDFANNMKQEETVNIDNTLGLEE